MQKIVEVTGFVFDGIGQNGREGCDEIIFFEDVCCLEHVIDQHAHDTEFAGFGEAQCADINIVRREDFRQSVQRAGFILKENRNLFDAHGLMPPLDFSGIDDADSFTLAASD